MFDLSVFLGKKVKIVDDEGILHVGKVKFYNPENDFDDNEEESIDLDMGNDKKIIQFYRSEINSIQLV